MRSSYLHISIICVVIMLSIIAYGTYRCNTKDYVDPLTKSIGPVALNRFLDGWGITHFMFYGILAYMFPDKRSLIFIAGLGVTWEIIEIIFKEHPFYLADCKYPPQTDAGAGWWYGRWEDIVMNSLGMLTGFALRKRF